MITRIADAIGARVQSLDTWELAGCAIGLVAGLALSAVLGPGHWWGR